MLVGKIEEVIKSDVPGWMRVAGWLADDENAAAPLEADLLVNGSPVRKVVADRPLRPAPGLELPSGARRFVVPVPTRWNRQGRNEFAIGSAQDVHPAVEALSIELDGDLAPATIAPPRAPGPGNAAPGAGPVRGRIQRVEDGVLHGWLWNPASADPVRFILLVNEKEVGEFVADMRRPDLVQKGIGTGSHAFRIRLRREWTAARRTTYAARILPGRERLPDALVVERPGQDEDEDLPGAPEPDPIPVLASAKVPAKDLTPDAILAAMRDWPTAQIVDFFARFETDVMLERGKKLLRERKWEDLASFLPSSLQSRKRRVEFNTLVGRGLLYHGAHADAAQVLAGAARVAPANAAVQFYTAVACARAGRLEEAVTYGRAAVRLAPANKQYLMDHGVACRRLATASTDGDLNLRKSLLSESIESFTRAVTINEDRLDFCLMQIARCQMELDRFDDTIATLERLQKGFPDHVDGLILLSQALVAAGRVKEALTVAESIVELDPLRQGPRFQLRTLQSLVAEETPRPRIFGLARWNRAAAGVSVSTLAEEDGALRLHPLGEVEFASDPAVALASFHLDWVLLAPDGATPIPDAATLRRFGGGTNAWAGRILLEEGGQAFSFWRRDLLVGLAESGLLSSFGSLPGDLAALESLVATARIAGQDRLGVNLMEAPSRLEPGPVVVMSRHGAVKFGGGEHFIASMARHYKDMGHSPVIVGTRPERVGDTGETADGIPFAFVDGTPAELRRYVLSVRPRFVHVLSGLGYEVAEALEYLDIPFVYGVHFWRDCLGLAENDTRFFANHDKEPIPRPAFRYLIEKAATIYSNSEFTRATLEEAFNIRTPVIYSLPEDVTEERPGTTEEVRAVLGDARDYVLLVNAKSDKGFDLLLEVAKRVPRANFLMIASQSDRRDAEAAVEVAGVGNVRIMDHTDRMDIVYSRARVVAVPSYLFIETFSRVCIEAQRHGKPVIGSTVGNVPYLLKRSGIILPEERDAWAREIARLYEDEDYYRERVEAARRNDVAYAYDVQRRAVSGMISTLPTSILIGVGSGIGNMLHIGPMIRNIARRLGRKVDLVMTEDHKHAHFLLQNDATVNSVYSLGPEVLRRRYDTVFITHSFGNARIPFQARDVIHSRDWQNFEPAGPLHETVYNLEAARTLLGIPYDESDVKDGYYIGNFDYRPSPAGGPIRVGFHGGSKEGFWRSKRWPHYTELAGRLQARGCEVMSFGIPEEYVPGTLDRTGGSIAEMTEALSGLDYLVSNDSGVMNIANALGLPVMALFGPTNPETRGPIGAKSRWLAIRKDCAPCETTRIGRATFLSGNCRCIEELPLDEVEAGILVHMRDLGFDGITPS